MQRKRPKRIILVRHGESTGNVDKGLYSTVPDYALDLTPKGHSQAEDAGREILRIVSPLPHWRGIDDADRTDFVRFYVSTHARTVQTYEGILKTFPVSNLDMARTYFDPRLREQDWGNLREASATAQIEAERDHYGAFHYRFAHGESCADVYDRLSTFLDTLHRDWENGAPENNIIVTHGRTMRVFLMRWFKWRPEEFEKYANPKNCKVVVMELDEPTNRYRLATPLDLYQADY